MAVPPPPTALRRAWHNVVQWWTQPAAPTDEEALSRELEEPEQLCVHRVTLEFSHATTHAHMAALTEAFNRRNAKRFLWPLRITTVIFFLANIVLIVYDRSRFGAASAEFNALLILRLAVMLPLCISMVAYTYTPWYESRTSLLALPLAMLGGCLIAYAHLGLSPGYKLLAVLVVYMFSFTPLSVWISLANAVWILIAYAVLLATTRERWESIGVNVDSASNVSSQVQLLNNIGVLAGFVLILTFIAHNLEYSLKQAYLDELRLRAETVRLKAERALSSALINTMLPPAVAKLLLQPGRTTIADSLSEVTVLFCELQLDTKRYEPAVVVKVLNAVYSAFDALIDVTGVHKIETVGEVYLCAGGCPIENVMHAKQAAEMALGMMAAMPRVREAVEREAKVPGHEIGIRIGMNSGPVAAGIVGVKNPRYKLIGDTVNTASRMESTCPHGYIQISRACHDALQRVAPNQYTITDRGEIAVKGKGTMYTYWLVGRAGEPPVVAAPPPSTPSHSPRGLARSEGPSSVQPPAGGIDMACLGPAATVHSPSAASAQTAPVVPLRRRSTLTRVSSGGGAHERSSYSLVHAPLPSTFAPLPSPANGREQSANPSVLGQSPGLRSRAGSIAAKSAANVLTAATLVAGGGAASGAASTTAAMALVSSRLRVIAQTHKALRSFRSRGGAGGRFPANSGAQTARAGGGTVVPVDDAPESRHARRESTHSRAPDADGIAHDSLDVEGVGNSVDTGDASDADSQASDSSDRARDAALVAFFDTLNAEKGILARVGSSAQGMSAADMIAASDVDVTAESESPAVVAPGRQIQPARAHDGILSTSSRPTLQLDNSPGQASAHPPPAGTDSMTSKARLALSRGWRASSRFLAPSTGGSSVRPSPSRAPLERGTSDASDLAPRSSPSHLRAFKSTTAVPTFHRSSSQDRGHPAVMVTRVQPRQLQYDHDPVSSIGSQRAQGSPEDDAAREQPTPSPGAGVAHTAVVLAGGQVLVTREDVPPTPAAESPLVDGADALAHRHSRRIGSLVAPLASVPELEAPALPEHEAIPISQDTSGAEGPARAPQKPPPISAHVLPDGDAHRATPRDRGSAEQSSQRASTRFLESIEGAPAVPARDSPARSPARPSRRSIVEASNRPEVTAPGSADRHALSTVGASRRGSGTRERHLKWEDRLTLCLNKPVMRGEAAVWEAGFQADMFPRWRRFVQVSIILLIVILVLFTASDAVKYASEPHTAAKSVIWRNLAIIRYAVLAPVLLTYLAATRTTTFRKSWAFAQATTACVSFAIGLAIIAISVVGEDPGFGVLALYIVYCANASLLALAFRLSVLLLLAILYIAATLSLNSASVSPSDSAFAVIYLVVFIFGEMCPVLLREFAVRQNYFRRFRIEVERRNLAEEQAKSTRLLENLMPPEIVPRLRAPNRQLIADAHDEVTILWTDMKGFTDFSSTRSPLEIVAFLNAMFSTFDRILDKYGVRKIEVLGDAFFCCAGVPLATPDHAERCANAALEMLMHMPILRRFAGAQIDMRVGIHTGDVTAAVVGLKDPRYHLFGDTVPMANAMESNGIPGRVHISSRTYQKLLERQQQREASLQSWMATHFPDPTEPLPGSVNEKNLSSRTSLGGEVEVEPEYPPVHMAMLDAFVHSYQEQLRSLQDRQLALAKTSQRNTGPLSPVTFLHAGWQNILGKTQSQIEDRASSVAARVSEEPPPDAAQVSRPSNAAEALTAPTFGAGSALDLFAKRRRRASDTAPAMHYVAESGEGALRGQLQSWQGSAFLGWNLHVNVVQGGFIYDALPDVAAARASLEAATASLDLTEAALASPGSPRDPAVADAITSGGPLGSPVASARISVINARASVGPLVSSSRPAIPSAGAASSDPRSTSASVPSFLSSVFSRNHRGMTAAASAGMSPREEPSFATYVNAHGFFNPSDPLGVFGPGGGFFEFEERQIELKSRGQHTTYLLGRGQPPYHKPLAERLAQLQQQVQDWAESEATRQLQTAAGARDSANLDGQAISIHDSDASSRQAGEPAGDALPHRAVTPTGSLRSQTCKGAQVDVTPPCVPVSISTPATPAPSTVHMSLSPGPATMTSPSAISTHFVPGSPAVSKDTD